jgi:hypothetical protein
VLAQLTPSSNAAPAVNVAVAPISGVVGLTVNGPTTGGAEFCGMTPMDNVRATALSKLVPTGTAVTTMLPTEPLCGAVTITDAAPFEPVRTSLCESAAPAGAFSGNERLTRWPATGLLFASRTVIVSSAVALPSRGNWSGCAASVTERPNSEGPIGDGAVCLSMLHPVSATAATSTAPARRRCRTERQIMAIPSWGLRSCRSPR